MNRYITVIVAAVLIIILALILVPESHGEEATTQPETKIMVTEQEKIMRKGVYREQHVFHVEREDYEQETVKEADYETDAGSEDQRDGSECTKDPVQYVEAEQTAAGAENAGAIDKGEEVLETCGDPVTEDAPETAAAAQPAAEPSITDRLYAALDAAGISWWYPYAYCQMMQESGGDPYAENSNGLDKGLFQFRISYWQEPESIFDADAQIRRYVRETAARIRAGLTIEEVISRHYTSDWVQAVDWEYVNHVMSRMQ